MYAGYLYFLLQFSLREQIVCNCGTRTKYILECMNLYKAHVLPSAADVKIISYLFLSFTWPS